ncbi:BatD family protein [Achromobacter xylosoxidans]
MKTAMLAGLLWALALACVPARAQDAAPALRVRAAIQDAARIAPGATVPLQLDVLTSTWFTQPPQLPALSLPGVMVTPATGEGAILHETIDGVAYSGLRYTYLLSPAAAGTVTVPPLRVSAKVGPGQRDAAGASQPLTFEVTATPATAGGAHRRPRRRYPRHSAWRPIRPSWAGASRGRSRSAPWGCSR